MRDSYYTALASLELAKYADQAGTELRKICPLSAF